MSSEENVPEEISMEELADFLSSLRTHQTDNDKAQFDLHSENEKYAVIPLSSSIGTFFAYTKSCDEIYHRGYQKKIKMEQLYDALKGVIQDHAQWVEGTGYVFVLLWDQYEQRLLERYMVEAFDPFEENQTFESRVLKVDELRDALVESIKPKTKKEVAELIPADAIEKDKTVLVPADSEFVLLTFSNLFLEDALQFETDFNNLSNLKMTHCALPAFGVFYGTSNEEFKARFGAKIGEVLIKEQTHVAKLVDDGAQISTSIVALFLNDRELIPKEKVPTVQQLIPKHRKQNIEPEKDESGAVCYRLDYSVFEKIAKLYCKLTNSEVLEASVEELQQRYKEKMNSRNWKIDFDRLVQEKDPISHLYQ